MLKSLRAQLKIKSISKLWQRTTGISLDNGRRIEYKTKEYINNLGLSPVDAWLTALSDLVSNIPSNVIREKTAQSLLYFLNEYAQDINASDKAINNSRESTLLILNNPEIKHMKEVMNLLGDTTKIFKVIDVNTDEIINLAWKNRINTHETVLLLMLSAGYVAKDSNPNIANGLFELCKLQSYQWSREGLLSTSKLEASEISEYLINLSKRISTQSNSQDKNKPIISKNEYPFSVNMPDITCFGEKRTYTSDNYAIFFAENIPSIANKNTGLTAPFEYIYTMAVLNKETGVPYFFVTLEKDVRGGSFLCSFDQNGMHNNYGKYPLLDDENIFIEKALEIITCEFDLKNIEETVLSKARNL